MCTASCLSSSVVQVCRTTETCSVAQVVCETSECIATTTFAISTMSTDVFCYRKRKFYLTQIQTP